MAATNPKEQQDATDATDALTGALAIASAAITAASLAGVVTAPTAAVIGPSMGAASIASRLAWSAMPEADQAAVWTGTPLDKVNHSELTDFNDTAAVAGTASKVGGAVGGTGTGGKP